MENTVDMNAFDGVLDDAAFMPEEEIAKPISTIEEAPVTEEQPPANEPGWIKKRIEAANAKVREQVRTEMQAEFEKMLAPYREAEMQRQAEALVASGAIKDKEMALEYLRLKGDMSVSAPVTEQPKEYSRDAQGRFAPKQPEAEQQNETDARMQYRAETLAAQANKLQQRGLDVQAVYRSNPEIQRRVLSGEWDFYDVAEAMTERRVPVPVRQTNGAGYGGSLDIASMTDEQFARLNARLAKGEQFK